MLLCSYVKLTHVKHHLTSLGLNMLWTEGHRLHPFLSPQLPFGLMFSLLKRAGETENEYKLNIT